MPLTWTRAFQIVQEMERQSKKRRAQMLKEEREQEARENAVRKQTTSAEHMPSVPVQPSQDAANPQGSSGNMTAEERREYWRRILEANDDLLSEVGAMLLKEKQDKEAQENQGKPPTPSQTV